MNQKLADLIGTIATILIGAALLWLIWVIF